MRIPAIITEGEAKQKMLFFSTSFERRGGQSRMQHFKPEGVGEQGTGFSFPMTGWPGPAAQGLFASV